MAKRAAIVGVGQTYHKSKRLDVNGVELINEAVRAALEDAQMTKEDIDAVVIGNMDHFEGINYVDMWSVDGSGGYLKPLMKVCTGGTTGSTVAAAGYYHAASGLFGTVLAIGWEKNSESDTTAAIITCSDPIWERPVFAGAVAGLATEANAYMDAYGVTEEDAARVAVRDHKHAMNNPYAHVRVEITVENVLSSPMLSYPVKLLDMCPRSDGACAVIFANEDKVDKITNKPAWVLATATRHNYTYFGDVDTGKMPTLYLASQEAYRIAGIKEPLKEIDLMELYIPYSFAGLRWIEALGVCGEGEAPKLVAEGVTDMGGELPINPSGGVLCTNPIGATGLLRVGESALQIMGRADKRQVPGAKLALATGFGGCMWSDVMILGAKKPG